MTFVAIGTVRVNTRIQKVSSVGFQVQSFDNFVVSSTSCTELEGGVCASVTKRNPIQ